LLWSTLKAGGVFSSGNDGSNFDFNPLVGTAYGAKGAIGLHHNGSDMVAAHQMTFIINSIKKINFV
jgi:hypothetical protein